MKRTRYTDPFAAKPKEVPALLKGRVTQVHQNRVDVVALGKPMQNLPVSEQVSWDLLTVGKEVLIQDGVVVATVGAPYYYPIRSETVGGGNTFSFDAATLEGYGASAFARKAADEEITGKWAFFQPVLFHAGTALQYDQVHVNNGELLVTNATVLVEDISSSDTTIVVADPVFSVSGSLGSVITVRSWVKVGNGYAIASETMRVTGGPNRVTDSSWSYSVVRGFGSSGVYPWPAGTALAEIGRSDGASAYDGGYVAIKGNVNGGPGIRVQRRTGAGASDITAVFRAGNLLGVHGRGNVYGLAVGELGAYDTSKKFLVFDPDSGFTLQNVDLEVFASSLRAFTVLSQAQTVNGESLPAGTVMAGDNSANQHNMLYRRDTGEWALRYGTDYIARLANGWFYLDGNMQVTGKLHVGDPTGPQMLVQDRTLGNGDEIHGMWWFTHQGVPWFAQWFNRTNGRVYWSLRKPATDSSGFETLMEMKYRQGNPAWGEDPDWDYRLDINAKTIVGELLAGKVRVNSLSGLSADLGEVDTGALNIALAPYGSAGKTGFYIWYGSQFSAERGKEIGMEWWKDGVLQGYWDSDLGALIFGPDDADGQLTLRREKIGFNVESSPFYRGADDYAAPGFYWFTKEAEEAMGRITFARKLDGLEEPFEESREIWLESFYKEGLSSGIRLAAWGSVDDVSAMLYLTHSNNRSYASLFAQQISLGSYLLMDEGTTTAIAPLSVLSGIYMPKALSAPSADRAFALVEYNDAGTIYQVLAWNIGGTPYMLGIDPTNNRLMMKVGTSGWRYVNTTAL